MKTITIEIQDDETFVPYIFKTADMPDIVAALCSAGGYQATIIEDGEEVENPIKPEQFAWQRVKNFATNELNHYRKNIKVQEATKDIVIPEVEIKGL